MGRKVGGLEDQLPWDWSEEAFLYFYLALPPFCAWKVPSRNREGQNGKIPSRDSISRGKSLSRPADDLFFPASFYVLSKTWMHRKLMRSSDPYLTQRKGHFHLTPTVKPIKSKKYGMSHFLFLPFSWSQPMVKYTRKIYKDVPQFAEICPKSH